MTLKAPQSYIYQGPPNPILERFMRDTPSTVHMFYNTVKYFGIGQHKFKNGSSISYPDL